MSNNPFDQYKEPSEYSLPDQSEAESMSRIRGKIARIESKSSNKRFWLWLSTAACILFLLTISLVLRPALSPQKLVAKYFEPFPNYEMDAVRGDLPDDYKKEVYKIYDAGNFEQAQSLFKTLKNKNANDQLYEAISMQANGQWASSLSILVQIKDEIKPEYLDAHQWHLALAKLQLNQKDEAISLIKTLTVKDNFYNMQARELLKRMK